MQRHPFGTPLGRLAAVAIGFGLLVSLCVGPLAAQTPPPDKPKAASTRSERAAAQAARRKQMMERDAILRAKRTACLQERKDKKIPILERPRFIRECMAR
jgi:hypothetical protein